MSKTYTITVTEDQAKCIQDATELLSRIMGGQWNEIGDWLPLRKDMDYEEYHQDMDIIGAILSKHMKDGIDGRSASFGVGCPHLHRYHDIAWDLCRVIKHHTSWQYAMEQGWVEDFNSPRDWTNMLGCAYDEPMVFGVEPLAKMERTPEELAQGT